ncbi:uncharacterized protein LOC130766510 [Actinidia eriantha]|uniref:uncharacterized protein LOC130766510 n=1 Tax=Actinidia eriantha TaxID=165200 RepID=UPI00258B581F|nr:uncharacterized protein LOC130766510 [Actinidia eriantha]
MSFKSSRLQPFLSVNPFLVLSSSRLQPRGSQCSPHDLSLKQPIGGPTSPHNNDVQSVEGLRNVTRGHDESPDSKNCGNLIEMIKLMGKLNVEINDVVLEKAHKNAKYTSPTIQKEILHILAYKVRTKIREEIEDAKFCILIDEAKDASNREQMAIVLRFVDVHDFLRERFFEIVHITDTTALTLKKEISDVLARYNLNIENMRGQGASPKQHAELQDAQAIEIERTVTTAERVTGRGANQIATTERAFSAMKHFKTALRNNMEDEFLADSIIVYIEREISEPIDLDSIVDDFYVMKNRRAQLQ